MAIRRLGGLSAERGCNTNATCPDVFELPDGDFAVIGTDVTAELAGRLPEGSGCAGHERIVRIPRAVMLAAMADAGTALPDA